MLRVGIIGLGMMGRTHIETYMGLEGVEVSAIADVDPKRAAGDLAGTAGNVLEGGISKIENVRGTTDFQELIGMDDLDLVDICVPTMGHLEVVLPALAAGRNVLCEKPLARTIDEAKQIAAAAKAASGLFMPAMCMRFWPGWTWLKEAVDDKRFGAVRGATFRRMASMPKGWYCNGELSGGALLDLHIHDTDFVNFLFGTPSAVYSSGYSQTSGEPDHILTHYVVDGVPLVAAEGAWCLADGFEFSMRFTVNFENATADFDLARENPLVLFKDGESENIECAGNGYEGEIGYFLDCIREGKAPETVGVDDAVTTLAVLDAEKRSMESGVVETVNLG